VQLEKSLYHVMYVCGEVVLNVSINKHGLKRILFGVEEKFLNFWTPLLLATCFPRDFKNT